MQMWKRKSLLEKIGNQLAKKLWMPNRRCWIKWEAKKKHSYKNARLQKWRKEKKYCLGFDI